MRTFALLAVVISSLLTAACVDTPDDSTDVTALAREAGPIARELPSALHDEPATDTVSPPADDGSLGANPIGPAQPSLDTLDPSASHDRLDTLDPGPGAGTASPESPIDTTLPCRPLDARSANSNAAPATTSAYELGQRARTRWARLHATR